jgi:hypothetical protein
VEVCFTRVEDCRGVELLPCGVVVAEPLVEPLAAGVGACTGATSGGVTGGGVTVLCGFGVPAGDDTMTFGAGGTAACDPTDGKWTVPECSSSAIAPAPSRSGTASATTGRAMAQTPRPLSCSSADTGRSPSR